MVNSCIVNVIVRLYSAVKVLFATAIFCTYGVQFYVPIEIISSHMEWRLSDHSWKRKYGEYILRAAFLFMTCKCMLTLKLVNFTVCEKNVKQSFVIM